MNKFYPRNTKPEKGNPYYNTKDNGGYSAAIKGNPVDPDCNVLSNCVGYAYGRFNEIGGYGCCKYLFPTNAEKFIQYKGDLEVGQTPKLGACMVWQKGGTLSGNDGAGHVAIVEKVISETEVVTSESAWGGSAFWNETRKKGSGNWGFGSGYTFLGFIYNPAECCVEQSHSDVKKIYRVQVGAYGEKENAEKMLQRLLEAGFPAIIKEETAPTECEEVKLIVENSVVRVNNGAKDYNGGRLADFVYNRNHVVKSISNNRAVITYNGVTVAAVNIKDLTLIE